MTDSLSKHTVLLYTKEGCHLCERAREVLRRLESDFDLDVQEVDITSDPALFERYQYTIPVVVIDARYQFEPTKIAEHYLRRFLDGRGSS